MKKVIKSTDLIPPLFDISRYSNMDKISAKDWYFLLEIRVLIHSNLLRKGPKFWCGEELNEIEEQEVKELLIKNFFNNPLDTHQTLNYKTHNGEMIDIPFSDPSYTSFMKKNLPVARFTEDQFTLLQFIRENYESNDENDENDENDRPILDTIHPIFSGGFSTGYPISINPYFPDNVIVDELKKLLVNIRRDIGFFNKNKAITKKDLISWSSYKLLPYFDLKILEICTGVRITNAVICSLLYPKGEYGEENLRKSVEPLRQKILNQRVFDSDDDVTDISILDGLCYLAMSEAYESGKIER